MSEINPSDLVEEITLTVDDASVIPTPIDPTLTQEGEAADAKATGDAITAVFSGAKVNGKAFVSKEVTVYAGDILMSDETGADTLAEAVENLGNRDASSVVYDAENLVSVKDALDAINTELDTELTESEIDDIFDEVFGGDE